MRSRTLHTQSPDPNVQEAEFREQCARSLRSVRPRYAVCELGSAIAAWTAANEPERARACWVTQAEIFEELAVQEGGTTLATYDYGEAADAWERAGNPESASGAWVRAGHPTEALRVWKRVGDSERLARDAEGWAAIFESSGDFPLVAAIWTIADRLDRVDEAWGRAVAPYLPDEWIFGLGELNRDSGTGETTHAIARVYDPDNDWRKLAVEYRGGMADLVAPQKLLDHLATIAAAVHICEGLLSNFGGWALVCDGRLPDCGPDGIWRLGARHVKSGRLLETHDKDPLVVCTRLASRVQAQL